MTPPRRWLMLALASGLAACSAARAPQPGGREVGGREVGGAASAAVSAAASGVAMPGPQRGRLEAAVALNLECERCHQEQAIEWRASLHRRADVEPAYRRSFAIEPLPFCRGCHAPEANPTEVESEAVGALGVGCVTCHVTDSSSVLAAPLQVQGARSAPHGVTRDARFADVGACAGCHQFAFPGAFRSDARSLMQSTILEHSESRDAGMPCAGCHMPALPGGRRDHRFAASREPAVLRQALRSEARRLSPSRVALTLTPLHPGHAFPTGDLFRRLELSAEAVGPDGMVLGSGVRYLTRHFKLLPGAPGRRLVSDDRVRDAPVTVELDVGDAGQGRSIAWSVAYQRVGHPNGVDDADAELEGEISLGSGLLPPLRTKTGRRPRYTPGRWRSAKRPSTRAAWPPAGGANRSVRSSRSMQSTRPLGSVSPSGVTSTPVTSPAEPTWIE